VETEYILKLPRLRPDQWAIVQHQARVKTLAMGRRWGKSVLAQCVAIPTAAAGARVAWCVPNYKNGRPLWRLVERVLGPLQKAGLCKINKSERTVEFTNRGFLALYSMDNPDSIRGESFHLIIADEAAMISETAWTDCIQPTAADHDADIILISTPKGRNWFYREFQRGLQAQKRGSDPLFTVASWTAPTSANPNPNIRAAALRARDQVPERTYRQEWLAEFLEDGGTVFRQVKSRIRDTTRPAGAAGLYVIGVDWGRETDFTVLTVLDANSGEVVDLDRFNKIGWSFQRGRIQNMAQKWGAAVILVEENSIGAPNLEELQRSGLPALPFYTNYSTKKALIEGLALSLERGELALPDNPYLTGELEGYKGEKNPATGRIHYGAEEGQHDDCVISLALADWARVHILEMLQLVGEAGAEDVTERVRIRAF